MESHNHVLILAPTGTGFIVQGGPNENTLRCWGRRHNLKAKYPGHKIMVITCPWGAKCTLPREISYRVKRGRPRKEPNGA